MLITYYLQKVRECNLGSNAHLFLNFVNTSSLIQPLIEANDKQSYTLLQEDIMFKAVEND